MPIITISRGSMSGGRTLAECVASALQIPCVGREILVAAAAKIGVSAEMLSSKLETSPGVWDRFTTERGLYVAAVQASLAELVAGGDLVYHGHAGHLLLRGLPAVLRVRLIVPMAMRLRAVMERQRLKPEAALAYIQKVDEGRVRWTRFLYNVDLTDPGLYDLVLSLESMSIRSACSVVSATARTPEFVVTAEVRKTLADFALASRVKLALATQPASRGLKLSVKADDGQVSITGDIPLAARLASTGARIEGELRTIVGAVAGVTGVEYNVRPFDQRM
jgi:cytidylate kinase